MFKKLDSEFVEEFGGPIDITAQLRPKMLSICASAEAMAQFCITVLNGLG